MDRKARNLLKACQRVLEGVDRERVKQDRKANPSGCQLLPISNARLGDMIAAVEVLEADAGMETGRKAKGPPEGGPNSLENWSE